MPVTPDEQARISEAKETLESECRDCRASRGAASKGAGVKRAQEWLEILAC